MVIFELVEDFHRKTHGASFSAPNRGDLSDVVNSATPGIYLGEPIGWELQDLSAGEEL